MTLVEIVVGATIAEPQVGRSQLSIVRLVPPELTGEVEKFSSITIAGNRRSGLPGVSCSLTTASSGGACQKTSHSNSKKNQEPGHRGFSIVRRVVIRAFYDILS